MSAEIRGTKRRRKSRKRYNGSEIHKGTYILPNLFTTANLFAGFYGIINSINGRFQTAAVAILVSCLFDILDGKVARFTRATSRFGVEYDSLADLVAFGVGPAVLVYLWALRPFGRVGWLAAFLFVACGALRLARFNVQVNTVSKKFFIGLPIPGAACMIATVVLFLYDPNSRHFSPGVVFVAVTYLLGFLMVSNIPYNSFKELEAIRGKPLPILFIAVVLLTIVAANPRFMLFSLLLAYVVSGPLSLMGRWMRGWKRKKETTNAALGGQLKEKDSEIT